MPMPSGTFMPLESLSGPVGSMLVLSMRLMPLLLGPPFRLVPKMRGLRRLVPVLPVRLKM